MSAPMTQLLDFIDRLNDERIAYTLSGCILRVILVTVVVPGERWEVEFHEDGDISVEVFVSRGGVSRDGAAGIEELFRRWSE